MSDVLILSLILAGVVVLIGVAGYGMWLNLRLRPKRRRRWNGVGHDPR